MGDLKVFRVRDGRATEIPGASVAVERELQSLIEANMEAMLGIRFLATEYRTGRHRGRVDSLGLDENGTPVVIEYKRSMDQNVISQALSYLVWLRDHHHEFERLVADRLGPEAAGAVDWSNPRVVCVAGEFTYHDTVAVEEIGRRIDLVVLSGEVGDAAGWGVAADSGVGSVVVVPVQPAGKRCLTLAF